MRNLVASGLCLLTMATAVALVPGGQPEAFRSTEMRGDAKSEKAAVPAKIVKPRKAVLKAGEAPIYVYGNMVYNNRIKNEKDFGIYRYVVNSPDPKREAVFLDPRLMARDGGSVWSADGYYATRGQGDGLYKFDVPAYVFRTSDWTLVNHDDHLLQSHKNYFFQGGWDYSRNRLYVPFDNDSTLSVTYSGFMDLPSLKAHYPYPKIQVWGGTGTIVYATAVDTDGAVYNITLNGDLYRLYIPTGRYEKIGNLQLGEMVNRCGAVIDPLTHTLYFMAFTQSDDLCALYIVDKKTAEPSLVWKLPDAERLNGLYMPGRPLAEAKAPAKPADMQWVPASKGARTGKVQLTLPNKTYDGSALTGELEYEVVVDFDNVAKTGKAQAGTVVSADLSFDDDNYHNIRVVVKNAAGLSPYAVVDRFIGMDETAPATGMNIAYADGKVKVSWKSAGKSAHDGDYSSEAMTYNLKRLPDGAEVAKATSQTSFEETMAADKLRGVAYRINAQSGGKGTSWVNTDTLVIGKIALPYKLNADDVDEVFAWRIVNNNGSPKTWTWNASGKYFLGSYDRETMDDWVISPSIPMEKGKVYRVKYKLSGYDNGYEERFEVKAGRGQNVKAMTMSVMDTVKFKIPRETPKEFVNYVVPDATADWNIGFHGCSELARYFIYLRDIEILAGTSAAAPLAVSELDFLSDDSGDPKGKLQFRMPTHCFNGNALTGKVGVKIYRDGTLIKSLADLEPGSMQTVDEAIEKKGLATYRLVTENAEGEGEEVSEQFYVGAAIPGPVTNVKAIESRPGYVKISWDAPEIDKDKNKFNPKLAKYRILDSTRKIVLADSISATEVEIKVCEPDAPATWMNFYVKSFSAVGESTANTTHTKISVGKALEMPFVEPFSNGTSAQNWLKMTYGNVSSAFLVDGQAEFPEGKVYSQNGDNGYYGFNGNGVGYMARLFTLKIHVSGKNPVVSMWMYGRPGGMNPLDILVNETGESDGFKSVKQVMQTADEPKWVRVTYSLKDYIGKDIQLGFLHTVGTTSMALLDNFMVAEELENDLSVGRFNIDETITPGTEYEAKITVSNIGSKKSGSYDLNVYRNDVLQATMAGDALEPAAEKTFVHKVAVTNGMPRFNSFKAEAVWRDDQDQTNNTSSVNKASAVIPDLARIFNLEGTRTQSEATLTWSAPDQSFASKDSVDDVESYKPFSNGSSNSDVTDENMGGWISIDRDGKTPLPLVVSNKTYTFPNSGKPGSFLVFAPADCGLTATAWKGNNKSKQAFLSLPVDGQREDWLISPELAGQPYDFKLFCRAPLFSTKGPEKFVVMGSDGSVNPDDFTALSDTMSIPAAGWVTLTIQVPYGCKRVAIVNVTENGAGMLIDDITLSVREDRYSAHKLQGYNVYRDGVKLNSNPIADARYTDATCPLDRDMPYTVTAVFDKGESGASNVWIAKAIVGIGEATADGGVSVATSGRRIIITQTDPEGITIYRVDGSMAARLLPRQYNEFVVDAPGIYLVNVANSTHKVIVK